MKRLLVLALILGTAWVGWKRYPALMERRPSHEAIIENRTGAELRRIRLTVDGQTLVKEVLADDARAVLPFRVGRDASFELLWEWGDRDGESTWRGGMVPVGPMVQRHTLRIDADAAVLYRAEPK